MNLLNGESMKKQFATLLILLPLVLFGQIREEIPIPISVEKMIQIPVQRNMSMNFKWFDTNKFTMSHSYSMSVGSFGNNPYSQGMYLNHMNYAFSDKLNIKAVVGMTHDPLHLGNTSLPGDGFSLDNMAYGAEISYRPTKNSIFKFSFEKTPRMNGYNSYNPYYSPYGYSYSRPSMFSNHYMGF